MRFAQDAQFKSRQGYQGDLPVKKIVRVFVFFLALAGTVGSLSAASGTMISGLGDPMPTCDPNNPNCKVIYSK